MSVVTGGRVMPRSREENDRIREESKTNILTKSVPYFAKNGVEGTKIGDLTKGIRISQGALYIYFDSKEDLYRELTKFSMEKIATDDLLNIGEMDVPPVRKLRYVSDLILKKLDADKSYVNYMILALEGIAKGKNKDENPLFELMRSIIKSGQKDGAFEKGDAGKTAEYFLSVIYIYSVKKVNDPSCAMLTSSELERVIRG